MGLAAHLLGVGHRLRAQGDGLLGLGGQVGCRGGLLPRRVGQHRLDVRGRRLLGTLQLGERALAVRGDVGGDGRGVTLGRGAELLGLVRRRLHQVPRPGAGLGPDSLRLEPGRRQQLLGRCVRPLEREPRVLLAAAPQLVELGQPVGAELLELATRVVAHPVGVALGPGDQVVRGGVRALGRLLRLLLGDAQDLLRPAAQAGEVGARARWAAIARFCAASDSTSRRSPVICAEASATNRSTAVRS